MELRFAQLHVMILNFVLVVALAIVSAMCVRDVIARAVSNESDAPVAAAGRRARQHRRPGRRRGSARR